MTRRPRWLRARRSTTATTAPDGGLSIPAGVTGALALVVAGLAAVGVSGDLLARSVRNHPVAMAAIFSVTLLSVGVPAAVAATSRLVRVPLVLLLATAVIGMFTGSAFASSDREQPSVSVSAASTASATTLTIDASGNGLRSRDDMLVQVQGVVAWPADTADPAFTAACDTNRRRVTRPDEPQPSWPGGLLLWQQSGPDAKGAVAVTAKVELAPGSYQGVCVFVALRSAAGQQGRAVSAFLRLPGLTFPSPTVGR